MSAEDFFFACFRVGIRPAIPQKAEVGFRNSSHFFKDIILGVIVEVLQGQFPIAIRHNKAGNRPCEATQVRPHRILHGLFFFFHLLSFHVRNGLSRLVLNRILHKILSRLHQLLHGFFHCSMKIRFRCCKLSSRLCFLLAAFHFCLCYIRFLLIIALQFFKLSVDFTLHMFFQTVLCGLFHAISICRRSNNVLIQFLFDGICQSLHGMLHSCCTDVLGNLLQLRL